MKFEIPDFRENVSTDSIIDRNRIRYRLIDMKLCMNLYVDHNSQNIYLSEKYLKRKFKKKKYTFPV
jgi:AraC-like DNA-binding protein